MSETMINRRLAWWLGSQAGLLAVSALVFPRILSRLDPPPTATLVVASESAFQIMLLILMLIGILTTLLFWRAVRGQASRSIPAEVRNHLVNGWPRRHRTGRIPEHHVAICPVLSLAGRSFINRVDRAEIYEAQERRPGWRGFSRRGSSAAASMTGFLPRPRGPDESALPIAAQ